MELTDLTLISSLLAECRKSEENRTRRGPIETVTALYQARRKRSRCRCGHCKACIDNARWEQIFSQKFADPDYYRPRPPHFGSSLGWLR